MAEIIGLERPRQNIHERAARQAGGRLNTIYENHEFTVPGLTSNVSLKSVVSHAAACTCARAAGAFVVIPRADQVSIRNYSSLDLIVRFGSATADPVTVSAGEILYWTFVEVSDLFISNASALGVPVRIALG